MGGIHIGRWIGSGLAAGMLIWVVEGLASLLYIDDVTAALEASGLTVEMSGMTLLLTVVVSLLVGLVLMFFYAAARPRFGPGPATAVRVGVALWCGGLLVSLLGYGMIGLYPTWILAVWAAVGLLELVLAALVGGWIYREDPD